jgi:hypothetical protein
VATSQMTADKREEFRTGGSSPPTPMSIQLAEELAQIIADALHEDMKQYPKLSDIPAVSEPIVASRPESARGRRTRRTTQEAATPHKSAA